MCSKVALYTASSVALSVRPVTRSHESRVQRGSHKGAVSQALVLSHTCTHAWSTFHNACHNYVFVNVGQLPPNAEPSAHYKL